MTSPPSPTSEAPVPERPQTILILDDSPTVLEACGAALEEAGFRVVTLTNPFLFGSALRQHQPDLVLVDFNMPGLTGVQAVRAVAGTLTAKNIPVFLFSTASRDVLTRAVAASGASGFILKSDAAELVQTVRRSLGL